MPILSAEDQRKVDQWHKKSPVEQARIYNKRRDIIQMVARGLGVLLIAGTFGFLIFAAVDLSRQLSNAMNVPPAFTIAVTASNDVVAGTVCAIDKDNTVKCGGLKVNVSTIGVAGAFVGAAPAATSTPTFTGFRIDSSTRTVVFSRTYVDASSVATGVRVASAPTEEALNFNTAVTNAAAATILATCSAEPFDAVVTLHGAAIGSGGRALVLSFRASGAATSTPLTQLLLGTTTAATDAMLTSPSVRISVVAVDGGILVVQPLAGACVVTFVSAASGAVASQYDLSLLGVTTCPNATAVLYERKVLVVPSSPNVILLGVDTTKRTLSAQQTIRVVEQASAVASMVLTVIPAQVVGFSGFVTAVATGSKVIVRIFALSPDGAFTQSGVTTVGPRSLSDATWRFASIEAMVYRPGQQDIAVITRDTYGTGFLFIVDIATPGTPSEMLSIGALSSYSFGQVAMAPCSCAMIVAMRPDGASGQAVGVLAVLEWIGGYRMLGVAATSVPSGATASVVVSGVSTTLGNLRPGQQYALGPNGNVVLAASLVGPCIVLGEAITPTQLDLTLRHNRNNL